MNRLFFSFIVVLSCFISVDSAVGRHKPKTNQTTEQWSFQVVFEFSEMPNCLLDSMHLMGCDQSLVLNEFEGRFVDRIFGIDSIENSLVGKKVAFYLPALGTGKIEFFSYFKEHFANKTLFTQGIWLCRFNSDTQLLYGDYDALVVYWYKYITPPSIKYYRKELRDYEKKYVKSKK